MKQVVVKYSQLLGKVLAFNALATNYAKGTKKTGTLGTYSEKKMEKGLEKIGSKKLYGSSLMVDRLLSY